MIRLLVFTTLYPNTAQPYHGIFVEERLRHLVATGKVQARVLAPVPWFPSSSPRFGRYAAFAQVPRFERRHGIDVWHPRYPVIPKIGMSAAPFLLAAAVWPVVRQLRGEYPFEVVEAHYLYPDGVAAVWIAKRLGARIAVTAHGSDVNVLTQYRWPKRAILTAARNADRTVTVSRSLAERLTELGVAESQLSVLRNGVDIRRFRPGYTGIVKQNFGLSGRVIMSVGHLVEAKGHHIALEAIAKLPEYSLLIVGTGPEEVALRKRINALGLAARVKLAGAVSHDQLAKYYADAFALVLASRREGMPSVVLEALACGTPVIATAVGGIAEVVKEPETGQLVTDRTPEALLDAVRTLAACHIDRRAIREYAERFDWYATSRAQLELFQDIMQLDVATAGSGA
ncbi:MAG TPA: glycosyltransferase family 4 protein [Gammaproteobacteria bacterium]|nr:glycosyltransferase family 4 protein [Gammaproteobacteria bacterium]